MTLLIPVVFNSLFALRQRTSVVPAFSVIFIPCSIFELEHRTMLSVPAAEVTKSSAHFVGVLTKCDTQVVAYGYAVSGFSRICMSHTAK